MRAYNGEKTVDAQLHDLLQDEAFLHGKGLNNQRRRTMKKAKDLAEKYERFPALLTLLKREGSMLIERKTKDFDEVTNDVHKQEKEIIDKIINEFEYRVMAHQVFLHNRLGADINNETFQKEVDELMKNPIFEDISKAKSFHAKERYWKTITDYARLKDDRKKAVEYNKRIVELYEENPHFIEDDSIGYKIACQNYLNSCYGNRDLSDFPATLKKIKALPNKNFNEDGEVFQDVSFLELLYYMNLGDFDAAKKLVPAIEEGLKFYAPKINKSSEISFYYNITILYFFAGDNKLALYWLNKIFDADTDVRQDLQNFAKVLQLILHYETGKHDLLEYLTRSAYRYLQNQDRLYDFERLLIKYLKDLPFNPSESETMTTLKNLEEELRTLYENPEIRTTNGMEEMLLWLKAKTEGKDLLSVLKSSLEA